MFRHVSPAQIWLPSLVILPHPPEVGELFDELKFVEMGGAMRTYYIGCMYGMMDDGFYYESQRVQDLNHQTA